MSHKPKTVLIVDDDEGMRDTLTAILKREYRVLRVSSGEAALPILKKSRRFKRLPPRPDWRNRLTHLRGATNYRLSAFVYQTTAVSILIISSHARGRFSP